MFARKHNLFLAEAKIETDNKKKSKDKAGQCNKSKTETDDKNKTNNKSESESKDPASAGDKAKPAAKEAKKPSKEDKAIQLTKDGETDYSFGGDDTDRKRRPRASWSKDSKAFYITRSDSRGVADLFLVNSLAHPRPTLQKYKYPLPGEKKVRVSELSVYHVESKRWTRLKPKWKDESYSNIHWGQTSDKLRFVRRDRLVRSVDVCELDLNTGQCQIFFSENVNNANLATQSLRFINDGAVMIWWSERSGWGHFYLYDRNGKLKNAITSGPWRAVRVVSVDEEKGLLYFSQARTSAPNRQPKDYARIGRPASEMLPLR